MNAKENFLRAIYYQDPEYVPRTNEDIIAGFEFKGNFQMEDWTDKWRVHWKIT